MHAWYQQVNDRLVGDLFAKVKPEPVDGRIGDGRIVTFAVRGFYLDLNISRTVQVLGDVEAQEDANNLGVVLLRVFGEFRDVFQAVLLVGNGDATGVAFFVQETFDAAFDEVGFACIVLQDRDGERNADAADRIRAFFARHGGGIAVAFGQCDATRSFCDNRFVVGASDSLNEGVETIVTWCFVRPFELNGFRIAFLGVVIVVLVVSVVAITVMGVVFAVGVFFRVIGATRCEREATQQKNKKCSDTCCLQHKMSFGLKVEKRILDLFSQLFIFVQPKFEKDDEHTTRVSKPWCIVL